MSERDYMLALMPVLCMLHLILQKLDHVLDVCDVAVLNCSMLCKQFTCRMVSV